MKKIVLLLLLLMMPMFIMASECDKEKHKEFLSLSESITYDNNYSKSSNTFTITIYNVFDGMHAEYKEQKYKPSNDNTIDISEIAGGERVSIDIYGNDNCSVLKRIVVKEPYYNKYYGSSLCNGYEDKLLMCSSQFTSVEVSKDILQKSIYNYNHNISQKTTKDQKVVKEETLFSKVTLFLRSWGIRIILAIISTILSISLFSEKYRKVKHGI